MHNFSELDILRIVLSMEEDGVKLYTGMYESAQGNREKQIIFSALANEEKNHADFFKKLYKEVSDKVNSGSEYYIFDNYTAEVVKSLVSQYTLSEEDLFSEKDQSFKEIINHAVEQEYRSIKLYSILARDAKADRAREFLYNIIREEEKHVIKLKEMIYYNKASVSIEEHIHFIENILNGMPDWVRVIDLDDNIIYANEAMKEELGYYLIGRKCFEVIGRTSPCSDCISVQAANMQQPVHKEEKINGKIFSVMSSPLKNLDGEVQAVIEVLRDVTKSKLMEEQIKAQNKKFSDDLKIARKLQCSLLPKDLDTDKISFTYTYQPCEAIGGDFFDIFQIDSDHVGVYIADVAGHGVPASMLTVFLRQTINKNELSPAQVLKHLYLDYNEADFGTELYITMFYAVIDTHNKKIKYANAGHNTLPILFNKDDLRHLSASGFPISNWVETVKYQEYEADFIDGDRLMLLTDGITDICNASGQRYDIRFVEKSLVENTCKNIEEIKNIIIKNTYNFAYGEELEGNELLDDITLVLLEFNK